MIEPLSPGMMVFIALLMVANIICALDAKKDYAETPTVGLLALRSFCWIAVAFFAVFLAFNAALWLNIP